jgi:hypothetical protein
MSNFERFVGFKFPGIEVAVEFAFRVSESESDAEETDVGWGTLFRLAIEVENREENSHHESL